MAAENQSASFMDATPRPRRADWSSYYFAQHPEETPATAQLDERLSMTTCSSPVPLGARAPFEAARHELVARAVTPEVAIGAHAASRQTPSSIGSAHVDAEPQSPSSALPRVALSYPSSCPPDDTFPLVMPQVEIAQRRPFTEHGKRIGKLKVMFCGAAGSGKTRLLHTIADCEDVVYCDAHPGSAVAQPTMEVVEIKASTQPYPAWKLLGLTCCPVGGETVMERNLVLVDTPSSIPSADPQPVHPSTIDYLDARFRRALGLLRGAAHLKEDEMQNLVASSDDGFHLVDAIVYCIAQDVTDDDLEAIKCLSAYATVLPVITKCDFQEEQRLAAASDRVRQKLGEFGLSPLYRKLQLQGEEPAPDVFVVSCIDTEVEASVLMQDAHTFDPRQSDLHHLVAALFKDDSPARLRYLASAKLIAARASLEQRVDAADSGAASSSDNREVSRLPESAAFTAHHVAEHNRRHDRRSRLRLSAWAERMQSSYTLARAHESRPNPAASEKSAEWIISRLHDFEDERRSPAPHEKDWQLTADRPYGGANGNGRGVDGRDPLGLIGLRERLSRRIRKSLSWLIEIGCGVGFCALAVSILRVL